jgi:hypothetical protein
VPLRCASAEAAAQGKPLTEETVETFAHALSPRMIPLMNQFPDRFSIIDFYLQTCATHRIEGFAKDDLQLMDIGKLDTLAQAEEFLVKVKSPSQPSPSGRA